MQHMLEGMDGKFLMAFKDDKIMSVALVVAEKEVLAMDGIYLLPVFESELDGRKRRMPVYFISEAMLFQKVKHIFDSFFRRHHLRLFA